MNNPADSIPVPASCGRRVAGLVLLIVGPTALAGPYMPFNLGLAVPLLLGLAFLGWSLMAKSCGLLIPGGILTGLGAGLLLQNVYGGQAVFLFCFAGGWGLITLLSLGAFARPLWWPLIPGGVMAVAGLMQLADPETRAWLRMARPYWPLALIGFALFLLLTKPPARE